MLTKMCAVHSNLMPLHTAPRSSRWRRIVFSPLFWQTAHTLSVTSRLLGCIQSRCWQPSHKSVGLCHMQLIYLSYQIKMNISLCDRGDKSSLDSYVSVFWVTLSCAYRLRGSYSDKHKWNTRSMVRGETQLLKQWSVQHKCHHTKWIMSPTAHSGHTVTTPPLKPTNELVRWVQTCVNGMSKQTPKCPNSNKQSHDRVNNQIRYSNLGQCFSYIKPNYADFSSKL